MKAILIQAPCWVVYSPPYNLALLKAVCKKEGHEILCLDFNIKFYKYLIGRKEQGVYDNPTNWYNEIYVQEIINKYSEFIDECVEETVKSNYKIIGFTVTGLNSCFSKEIAGRIKLKNPEKIIIFGGPYCSRPEFGEKLLHTNSYIDAVCCLEGEKVLPGLLKNIEKNNKIEYLPGMIFRDENNKIVDCFDIELVEDLNSLPFADYADFNLKEYISMELPLSTSRGCINKCIFCSETKMWKKYRFRSTGNIYEEIVHQTSKYPFIKSFFFNDSLINGNIKMLNGLCELLIKNRINISWGGQGVIRQEMTKELILKMKKAGFSHVSYGLETASSRILKIMGKRFTPEVAERVIRETKQAGVRTDVNIIIGFPTEREEDIITTANFLKRNKDFIDEIFFHPLVLSRGPYLYEHRGDFGIEFENEFNPNSWYSTKEENTLEKRLEILKFYKNFIGNKGESFFTLTDYYLFIADSNFDKGYHKKASIYYNKAKDVNKNRLKEEIVNNKLKICNEFQED